jgi:subtilisin family serine protease
MPVARPKKRRRTSSQRRGSVSRTKAASAAAADQPDKVGFLPKVLDRTVIAIPLLAEFEDPKKAGKIFDIIIDLNLEYRDGIEEARITVVSMITDVVRGLKKNPSKQGVVDSESEAFQYIFTSLDAEAVRELVRRDGGSRQLDKGRRCIYHIWPDFELKSLIYKSISTVKADAAHNAFTALGHDIVWAVVDSGIDGTHPHFDKFENLELPPPLKHRDFTARPEAPLVDVYGHGTHVAGIIAGTLNSRDTKIIATTRHRDEHGKPTEATSELDAISGMAPRCRLLSLKVLDDDGKGNGTGKASSIISALQYIQRLNGYGRRILVHGVNLSVGYDFEPEWFACGQSPLCVEVDRLVRSGVVVVVAAGNSGYGVAQTQFQGVVAAGLDLTINDPGNADLAITVGSTHRDMPHIYGVSYFSSKGPTGDGRLKPDLLAPGEKIVSCASSGSVAPARRRAKTRTKPTGQYREDSGTSMAAPHVSGVIAAFLSIRREFIKRPEEIKRIFLSTATDLNRAVYFQGKGLVDLMRAIQSV